MEARPDLGRSPPRRSETVAIRRVEAVVNPASGSVDPDAPEALKAILDAFGVSARVNAPDARDVRAAVEAAVAARPDLVVTLAGDGTANLAASLCGPAGPLVAPLPGGTLNFLPRALYGSLAWPEALRAALSRPVVRPVSGGEVGGRRFYCAAILGSPALWALPREAARSGKLARAWKRAVLAFRRAFMNHVRFQPAGGPPRRAVAVSLICPLVSAALQEETALEAALLDFHDALEALRLAMSNMIGDWRRDPAVTVLCCTEGVISARRPIPALFDGEMHIVEPPARIRFVPGAFRALAFDPPRAEPAAP